MEKGCRRLLIFVLFLVVRPTVSAEVAVAVIVPIGYNFAYERNKIPTILAGKRSPNGFPQVMVVLDHPQFRDAQFVLP